MGRPCTVCRHAERDEIEKEMINNVPNLQLAKAYGLNCDAVRTHKLKHLPGTLTKSKESKEVLHSQSLLDEINELISQAKDILNKSSERNRHKTSLSAIDSLRKIYEFVCKMSVYLNESQRQNEEKSKQKSLDALKENLSVRELLLFEKLLHKAETGDGAEVIDDYDDIDDEPYPTRRKKEANEFFDDEDESEDDVETGYDGIGDDEIDAENTEAEDAGEEEDETSKSKIDAFNLSNFNKDWTHGKLSSHGKLVDGSGRRVSDL